MKKEKLIVIEGATDGVGKTTQFNLLKARLEREGEEVVTHHFPTYHSPEGHLVELYLQGKFGPVKSLSPYFINSLYAIDRAIVWKTKLEKAYLEGKTILFISLLSFKMSKKNKLSFIMRVIMSMKNWKLVSQI